MSKILSFISFLLVSTAIYSQDHAVAGRVVDETGTPVNGASIIVKFSNRGTTADVNGNFQLKTLPNDILVISSIGYSTQEVSINSRGFIMVTLQRGGTEENP